MNTRLAARRVDRSGSFNDTIVYALDGVVTVLIGTLETFQVGMVTGPSAKFWEKTLDEDLDKLHTVEQAMGRLGRGDPRADVRAMENAETVISAVRMNLVGLIEDHSNGQLRGRGLAGSARIAERELGVLNEIEDILRAGISMARP